jgi:phosphoribosylamine--glycine ligase
VVTGTLGETKVAYKKQATVCKYAVPEGYPDDPVKDSVVEIGSTRNAHVFYSSVYEKDGKVFTTGSRAIAVLGTASTIHDAEKIAQDGICALKGRLYSRRDIGTEELISKRIQHLEELRA